ncbi:MAG: glycosyltransferase [Bacteroidales bacterium]|nr:glycosyltransferase [Bacteroidales bacterium]
MNNSVLTAIFVLFCTAGAIQLFYYLFFYLAPPLSIRKKTTDEAKKSLPPLSVIICAKNESSSLRKYLPAVLEQDYPSFEVIVVNDCSEDDTYKVLGDFSLRYPHLKISNIAKDPRFTHSKKFAQFIGIKAAVNEILVFTDADCFPVSHKWLRNMAENFDERINFVLGYGGVIREKGLLNLYQRWETMFIAIQYLGMAIRGIPYMGVGRNLAYRRKIFFENRGYGPHNLVASGDDDLFVNSNATAGSVKTEIRRESHTRTPGASSPSEWVKRKIRHLSTARYYKFRHKVLLATEPSTRLLFYATGIFLLSHPYLWQATAAIIAGRMTVMASVLCANSRKLDEKGVIAASLVFDIISPLLNLVLYSSAVKNKNLRKAWK